MIISSFRVRSVLIILAFALGLIYMLPTFTTLPKGWWFHKKPINYGLDIKGGAHLVYGVDVGSVITEKVVRTSRSLLHELQEKGVAVETVKPSSDGKLIEVTFPAASKSAVKSYVDDFYGTVLQVADETESSFHLKFLETRLQEYRKQVIGQAIEVIRNRVDELGVAEPSIAAQGDHRVVVQLPCVEDPKDAKALINRAAKLTFRIVSQEVPGDKLQELVTQAEKDGNFKLAAGEENGLPYSAYVKKINEAVKGKIPEGTYIAFQKQEAAATLEAGKTPFLLKTDTDLGGDQLEDAFVNYHPDTGAPVVIFSFDPEGRRRFSEITGANVGQLMAIVLDDVVQSAPNIRGKIDTKTAQIELGRGRGDETMKEAQFIATTLRAGALPAALEQVEERTVGPSVGADAVQKGKIAGVAGLLIVAVFMTIWYKGSGIVATIGLACNVFFLLAILAALGATLTLPGIAGIVLTIGMAVDANVIIFERIKEELVRGTSPQGAVRDGYQNAFSAIMDSNVTTAMVAIILYYFGSGPIRGFGVTLVAGIVTSLFTAIFVTRYIFDFMILKAKAKTISI